MLRFKDVGIKMKGESFSHVYVKLKKNGENMRFVFGRKETGSIAKCEEAFEKFKQTPNEKNHRKSLSGALIGAFISYPMICALGYRVVKSQEETGFEKKFIENHLLPGLSIFPAIIAAVGCLWNLKLSIKQKSIVRDFIEKIEANEKIEKVHPLFFAGGMACAAVAGLATITLLPAIVALGNVLDWNGTKISMENEMIEKIGEKMLKAMRSGDVKEVNETFRFIWAELSNSDDNEKHRFLRERISIYWLSWIEEMGEGNTDDTKKIRCLLRNRFIMSGYSEDEMEVAAYLNLALRDKRDGVSEEFFKRSLTTTIFGLFNKKSNDEILDFLTDLTLSNLGFNSQEWDELWREAARGWTQQDLYNRPQVNKVKIKEQMDFIMKLFKNERFPIFLDEVKLQDKNIYSEILAVFPEKESDALRDCLVEKENKGERRARRI